VAAGKAGDALAGSGVAEDFVMMAGCAMAFGKACCSLRRPNARNRWSRIKTGLVTLTGNQRVKVKEDWPADFSLFWKLLENISRGSIEQTVVVTRPHQKRASALRIPLESIHSELKHPTCLLDGVLKVLHSWIEKASKVDGLREWKGGGGEEDRGLGRGLVLETTGGSGDVVNDWAIPPEMEVRVVVQVRGCAPGGLPLEAGGARNGSDPPCLATIHAEPLLTFPGHFDPSGIPAG